jgi:hypothetical protein
VNLRKDHYHTLKTKKHFGIANLLLLFQFVSTANLINVSGVIVNPVVGIVP